MYIDTHAHLTDKIFEGQINDILSEAKQSKVEKIITSGFDLNSSKEALDLAKKYDNIYCSIGVYPENIYDYNEQIENQLKKLSQNKKVVAIGEIGLQYTENMPEHEKQKEVFLRQIKLAKDCKLPVVLHCREAYGDMISLLKKNKDLLTFGGTFHCFSGSYEIAKEAIKLGLYISVGGVSTFKNAQNVKNMLKNIPLENIILETDCPYLIPHSYRGKVNKPSYIPLIAENLAIIKGCNIEQVENITTQNANNLFKI